MQPHTIRQVISLGSPFGEGRESGSYAGRLHQRLNPAVWYLVADRLCHDETSWQPFKSRLFNQH